MSDTKSSKKKSSIFSLMSLFGGKKDKEPKEEQKVPQTSSIHGKEMAAMGDPLEDEDILKIDRL